jgi:hypothetical protein
VRVCVALPTAEPHWPTFGIAPWRFPAPATRLRDIVSGLCGTCGQPWFRVSAPASRRSEAVAIRCDCVASWIARGSRPLIERVRHRQVNRRGCRRVLSRSPRNALPRATAVVWG